MEDGRNEARKAAMGSHPNSQYPTKRQVGNLDATRLPTSSATLVAFFFHAILRGPSFPLGGGGLVQFSKTLRQDFLYLPIFRRSRHHLEDQETQVLYIIVQLSQPSYYSKISVYS